MGMLEQSPCPTLESDLSISGRRGRYARLPLLLLLHARAEIVYSEYFVGSFFYWAEAGRSQGTTRLDWSEWYS